MNIFTFFTKFNKIYSKTHQIAQFLQNFWGDHAPEPPSERGTWRKPPLFHK